MEILRELAAVGLVFGLLGAALWVLRGKGKLRWRRHGGARGYGPRLESLDRLVLSPQHALHLVRASDQVLMLVTHAGGCTLLTPQPPATRGASPEKLLA